MSVVHRRGSHISTRSSASRVAHSGLSYLARQGVRSVVRAGVKRAYSMTTPRTTPNKRPRTQQQSAKTQTGVGSRQPAVSRSRFSKSVSFNPSKKKEKLPKGFAKKVALALKKTAPRGVYSEVVQDVMFNQFDNLQNPQPVPYALVTNSTTTCQGLLFDPTQVLYAASTLFNGFQGVSKTKTPGAAGLFNYQNIVVDVINSSADMVIHNNSQRTYILDIYDCAVKVPGNYANIRTEWINAMTQDANSGVNPLNSSIANMYQCPNLSPEFKKYHKTGLQHVVLEPGQIHTLVIPGPKMMKYDFTKFWKDGVFINQQKMVRKPLIIAKLDVIGAKTSGGLSSTTGRLREEGIVGVNGLLIETKVNYKISMPEQTGFVYPTSTLPGVSQPLTYRHMAYALINYNTDQAVGDTEVRIDEEQPQTTGLGAGGAPV